MIEVSLHPTIQKFIEAFVKKDMAVIDQLLESTGNNYEIQIKKSDRKSVNKKEYLKWLKPKLLSNTIYDVSADKCMACVVGNPVILFNYGGFPYISPDSSYAVNTGIMIEVKNDKITQLKFCNSIGDSKIRFVFEIRGEIIKKCTRTGYTFHDAYKLSNTKLEQEAFIFYKQTNEGLAFKTIYFNDEIITGLIGKKQKAERQHLYSKNYSKQLYYSRWCQISKEYNYVPEFKLISVEFDLSNLHGKDKVHADMIVKGALYLHLYLNGLGIIKYNYINLKENTAMGGYKQEGDYISALLEVPNIQGIEELVLNSFSDEFPPVKIYRIE